MMYRPQGMTKAEFAELCEHLTVTVGGSTRDEYVNRDYTPPPPPTAAEIRQAVAFGKQAVIRELVDALEGLHREMYNDRFRPPSDVDYERGLVAAINLVKGHQIEGEPKP